MRTITVKWLFKRLPDLFEVFISIFVLPSNIMFWNTAFVFLFCRIKSMWYKMKIWLIIFLVLTVSNRVLSQLRLVVNTTCLKLAKPSNQQFRLSCRQYDYHCLLDETFTKEFEVCREWKWIPGGKWNSVFIMIYYPIL